LYQIGTIAEDSVGPQIPVHRDFRQSQPFPAPLLDEQLPWLTGKLRRGEMIAMNRLPEDLPGEATAEKSNTA
jgi:hypothetical protein